MANNVDRITQLLRSSVQPQDPNASDISTGFLAAKAAAIRGEDPMKAYQSAAKQRITQSQEQFKAQAGAEVDIYNIMQKEAERGNHEAAAIMDTILKLSGNDIQKANNLMNELHKDPEDINSRNILRKAIPVAAKLGYTNIGEVKPVEVNPGSQLVNPQTGEVIFKGAPKAGDTPLGKALLKSDIKQIDQLRKDADAATTMKADVAQMRSALKDVGAQGPISGRLNQLADTATFGLAPGSRGARDFVESKGTALQLGFTNMTKGAISDREMGLFSNAVPSVSKTEEGSNKIMNAMDAGAERKIQERDFKEAWLDTYGSLTGANATWNKYINENPILDQNMNVNRENISNWDTYLQQQPKIDGSVKEDPLGIR